MKYFFCGIGGSGMSPLAFYLKQKGFKVIGSDRSFDKNIETTNLKYLKKAGVEIYPQNGQAVTKGVDYLVASSAIEDSIPDIKKAKEIGVKIIKRSELLAEIFHSYKKNIAVAGTSGKTTITAMIGFLLDQLGKKPSMINGGIVKNFHDDKNLGNVISNEGDICVIEADESDGSIENYNPYISVISNITKDHKPIDELLELFDNLIKRTKHKVFINLDCKNLCDLVDLNDDKIVTYSTKNPKADFYAEKIKYLDFASKFMVGKQNFNLKVAGEFNISNALIAIGVLSSFGVDLKETAKAIELFRGVKRRLDIVGEHDDIKIIDDFAHNPDKIKASLSALKRTKKRLLVMFQPHGFAPTKFLQNEFVEVFSDLLGKKDVLVMPEIFFAGGTTNKDISSKDLIDKISKNGVNANFIEKRKDIISFVKCNVKKGDIVVIMGARDNSLTDFSRQILDTIKRKDIC